MTQIYGVKVIVNGRSGWAKLPDKVKGYPTLSEAQIAADQISRSTGLAAFVEVRKERAP